MGDFIGNAVLWTLAFYGLFEIIKTILYTKTYVNMNSDGIYVIIAVKNQENKIEGMIRTMLFRILYGKEEYINDIIVTDLDSSDNTVEILNKLKKEYECITVSNWRECKEKIDRLDHG